jgi:V/A-type H+-transporting ATPase subunit A
MVKQYYLQQNAFHDVDQYSSPQKTFDILELILDWADHAYEALEEGGALVEDIVALDSSNRISELKFEEDYEELLTEIRKQMETEFEEVVEE